MFCESFLFVIAKLGVMIDSLKFVIILCEMVNVSPKLKKKLLDAGKYSDYVKAFEDAISRGESEADASVEASKSVGEEFVDVKKPRKPKIVIDWSNRISYTEAVRWAYVNSVLGNPKFDEAPSAEAWCLMLDFKKDDDYRRESYKQVFTAKIKKEEIEEVVSDDRWDGKEEYDILCGLTDREAEEIVK